VLFLISQFLPGEGEYRGVAIFISLLYIGVAVIQLFSGLLLGWLGGSLTSTGEKVLDDIEGYEEELHAGYAFQDGISGAWLPRFCKDLSIIEPDKYDESGYPAFLQTEQPPAKAGGLAITTKVGIRVKDPFSSPF